MISTEKRLLQQDAATREPQPVRIPVPRVIRGTALLFIGFFVVTASLILVSRSTGVRFDVFDTYANILPGQPWANAEASGFECGLYNHTDHYECSLRPATGIFSRISVTRYNDAINRVIFTPRANGLALGEVALALGVQPAGQKSHRWTIDEFSAVVWMDASRFNNFYPVRQLSLYRTLPDRVND